MYQRISVTFTEKGKIYDYYVHEDLINSYRRMVNQRLKYSPDSSSNLLRINIKNENGWTYHDSLVTVVKSDLTDSYESVPSGYREIVEIKVPYTNWTMTKDDAIAINMNVAGDHNEWQREYLCKWGDYAKPKVADNGNWNVESQDNKHYFKVTLSNANCTSPIKLYIHSDLYRAYTERIQGCTVQPLIKIRDKNCWDYFGVEYQIMASEYTDETSISKETNKIVYIEIPECGWKMTEENAIAIKKANEKTKTIKVANDNNAVYTKCDIRDEIIETINNLPTMPDIRKENKIMNMFKNIKFGPCNDYDVSYSFKGIAYRTSDNSWVSYDADEKELIDVSDFIISDFRKMLYYMPVNVEDVEVGDIVIHNSEAVFVVAVNTDGFSKFTCMRPYTKEIIDIVPEKSIFGFNFMTKIVDIFGGMDIFGDSDKTDANSILPFLFMSNGEMSTEKMLPMMLMMNKGESSIDMNTVLMMSMMNGKSDMNSMIPFMLMSKNGIFGKKDK